jgi:DNA repair exonuclease SbcCD ATPase subunit
MNDVIKKWADFSDSDTKPLFWILLGPLLVILTLIITIPNVSSPSLPLLTVMGFVLSWKYRGGGLALTLMVFVIYFAFHYFFGHHEAFLWKLGWGCSLALGLTISFLSMEELKTYYAKQKKAKEQAVQELQISLHSFEEKTATEKRFFEHEIDTLKEELISARDEGQILLGLVDASRIESDKTFKQNETLLQETIEGQRELARAHDDLEKLEERHAQLTIEHRDLEAQASKRLQELNTLRVEVYQAKLFAENYRNQVEKARAYFKAQKKEAPLPKPPEDQNSLLKTLEKDKEAMKEVYEQLLTEYQGIKTAPERSSQELKEKKQKLEKTKATLVGIERDIFVIKKGLQEKGAYVP